MVSRYVNQQIECRVRTFYYLMGRLYLECIVYLFLTRITTHYTSRMSTSAELYQITFGFINVLRGGGKVPPNNVLRRRLGEVKNSSNISNYPAL